MLYTIAVVLIILWLLGLVTSYTMGGFIHVLLVIAIVMVLLRVISGRSPRESPPGRMPRNRIDVASVIKAAELALLVGGSLFTIFGMNALNSASSDISRLSHRRAN